MRLTLRLALIALLSLSTVSVALANAPAEGKEKNKAAFIDIHRYDLGIYTLVVFGGLFFILSKFAWKPIMDGLQKREDGIHKDIADAKAAKSAADASVIELQKKLAAGHDEVRVMLEEARRDAQALKDKLKNEATSEIQADRDRAMREIESAKDQAMSEIVTRSTELAARISSKAVRRELTPADHERLVDEALEELKYKVQKA